MTIGNSIISERDNLHSQLLFILYITEVGNEGNKNTYFNSVDTGNIIVRTNIQHKCPECLNDHIQVDILIQAFKNAKNTHLLYTNILSNSNYFIEGLSITRYYIKLVYRKLLTAYIVTLLKILNIFILSAKMLGGYGIIQKTGLEQYITITSNFQMMKYLVRNIVTVSNS